MDSHKIDPVLWLLFLGMVLAAGTLIFVEHFFKDDGQVFQVFAGLLASFSGAFFLRVKPREPSQPSDKIEHPSKVVTETKATVVAPEADQK